MGSRRLLGRRVRGQAARRSSSGLSSGSESRDRTYCRTACGIGSCGVPRRSLAVRSLTLSASSPIIRFCPSRFRMPRVNGSPALESGALAQVTSALFGEVPGREDRGGPDATQGRPRARPRGSRRSTAGLCHGSGLRGEALASRSIGAVRACRAPSGCPDGGAGRRLRARPIHTRRCSGRRDARLRLLRTSVARPVARGRTARTPRSRTHRPLVSRSPPSPHRRRRRAW
jgi:hypothetical protein